jgi:hypothetical protein
MFKSILRHFNGLDIDFTIFMIRMRYRANKPRSGVFYTSNTLMMGDLFLIF